MKTVLVLCTGNSCRSQMAEGYLRFFAPDGTIVYSAGVETHGVNPTAIQVMKEDGVDISHHTSKHVRDFNNISFDTVITVCDNAKEQCPYFPSATSRIHQTFPDPSKATGSPEEILNAFRSVRSNIKTFCRDFFAHA